MITDIGDVRQCNNGNGAWTCGTDVDDCSHNFTIPKAYVDDRRLSTLTAFLNLPLAYTTVGNTLSSAATGIVTVTVTSASSDIAQTSSGGHATEDKSKSAVVTGLGAGLGVGIPLLLALLTVLFFLHRTRKQLSAMQKQQLVPHHVPVREVHSKPSPHYTPVHEVPSDASPHEMSGTSTMRDYKVDTSVSSQLTR